MARLRNTNIENASSQNESSEPIATAPPMMRTV